jgi:hypothetical protein
MHANRGDQIVVETATLNAARRHGAHSLTGCWVVTARGGSGVAISAHIRVSSTAAAYP